MNAIAATAPGLSVYKRLLDPDGFVIIAKIKTTWMISPAENAGRAKIN